MNLRHKLIGLFTAVIVTATAVLPAQRVFAEEVLPEEETVIIDAGTTDETIAPSQEDIPLAEEDVPLAEEDVPLAEEDIPLAEEDVPLAEEELPPAEELSLPEEELPLAEEETPAAEETDLPLTIEEVLADDAFQALTDAEKATLSLQVEYYKDYAYEMLGHVNSFRTGSEAWYYTDDTKTTKQTVSGLSALQWDRELEKAAMIRAVEMLLCFNPGHLRPDNTSYQTIFTDLNIAYNYSAENASKTVGRLVPEDAKKATEDFKEINFGYSGQGHRRAMLDKYINCTGIACVTYNRRTVYVQLFANRTNITSGRADVSSKTTVQVTVPKACIGFGTEDEPVKVDPGSTKQLDTTVYPTVTGPYDNDPVPLKEYRNKVTKTYASTDTSIATVSGTTLTGVKPGNTRLRVMSSWNGFSGEALQDVTVYNIVASNISIVSGTRNVEVGKTLQLSVAYEPENVTNKKVTWSSDDPSIATIDANGLLTGVREGDVSIRCTYEDNYHGGNFSMSRSRTFHVINANTGSTTGTGSGTSTSTGTGSGSTGSGVTSNSGTTGGTWLKDGGSWWYRRKDGSYPASGWEKIDGTWYLFNGSGHMLTGWVYDGAWYYLYGSGAMATGWTKVGSVWYYMDGSGRMQTGWVNDGGTWYYMHGSGAMATGWVNDNGLWYYMDGSGAMQTGWVYDGAWYYMSGSGAMVTGWVDVGGTWYYMDGSGAMQTGWIRDGAWYYLDGSGAMLANTSRYIGGKTYYFNFSGVCTNP